MSQPSETTGRPLLALTANQHLQPDTTTTINPPLPFDTTTRTSPTLSDDCSGVPKPTSPHRRPRTTSKKPSHPHIGSSPSQEREAPSPNSIMSQAQSIHYTRTGRISKAKKGLKVHHCECGRSYTRAEHLRRHQKNHAQEDALVCDYPSCGKVFYRLDLLHRHQERHNDPGNSSPRVEYTSGGSPEPLVPSSTPQLPTTATLTSTSLPPTTSYTPTTIPSPKHPGNYTHRAGPQVAMSVEGPTSAGWGEQYSYSPAYSSSDGYASPIPGSLDYGNLYASMPYTHSGNRTRTPSNASLHEHWPFTPRSPSSSISTMPYVWATSEKMPLAYINTSYPMASFGMSTSIEATADYGQFGPRTMIQRDVDEAGILFQDQPYGMGQLAHTYLSEQYLNNYWRLFHPTFPIIHRPTFVGSMTSSPMLHAAMMAIDGQYSNDTSTKQNAKKLHDRCLKLLQNRKCQPITEPDRLCDYQAVFLIEVLSQFRARRAAKTLSPGFGTLYQKAAEECRYISAELTSIVLSLEQHENVTIENWLRWAELAVWQRLLASCYVLESTQVMLLAREPQVSLYQQPGPDLPFPAHTLIWDAVTIEDWAALAVQNSASPQYVYEISQASVPISCDSFQSSILIAVHYTGYNATLPYADATTKNIDDVLDNSFVTKQRLLTAKLMQVTPIRALLAVSGESWILFEKVHSQQAQNVFESTLRNWLNEIYSSSPDSSRPVSIAVEILQMALNEQPEDFEHDMGTEMGVYFAALVLWAVTTAACTRKPTSQQTLQDRPYRHHSQPPAFDGQHVSTSVPTTPQQFANSFPASTTSAPNMIDTGAQEQFLSQYASPARHDSLGTTTLLSHDQITFNTMSFLSAFPSLIASDEPSVGLGALKAGCFSMLLWVKMQFRGTVLDEQADVSMWADKSDDGLGELLKSIIGSLEGIMKGGWTRWGI